MEESAERRCSLYFKISVAIAALAVIPIYFLKDYYTHFSDMSSGFEDPSWENLQIFPDITPYFILFAVVIAIIGIRKGIRARVVWIGILVEFLYIFLNIFIYNVFILNSFHITGLTRFDPINIAGICLFLCSIAFSVASLGTKEMRFGHPDTVMVRITAFILALYILMLIEIMVPWGLRTTLYMPDISWSFPFAWGVTIPVFASVLVLLGKTVPIILFLIGIFVLIRGWRYGYLYISVVLFFFCLRLFEMIIPVLQTSYHLEEATIMSGEISYGVFYRMISIIRHYWYALKFITIIPPVLSFILGLYFLMHINGKTSDAS
jgi:hypothetical protein